MQIFITHNLNYRKKVYDEEYYYYNRKRVWIWW